MSPSRPVFPVTDQASFDNFQAAGLNNEAQALEGGGDLAGAESKHLEALRIKIAASGEQSIHTMLEAADAIRAVTGPKFDEACTKDNLGRIWEMKGDLKNARLWREKLAPNHMIYSYFQYPKSSTETFSKKSDLRKCAKCQCVFYCGRECQRKDWGRHKRFCKEVSANEAAVGRFSADTGA
ncbi:hypothetical protein DL98DRAFT_579513 [Cadophora sp. DSE1049]|nr:hypothetical protein DL98DRAFT_579513 [Cadophora sp. DSE1049]